MSFKKFAAGIVASLMLTAGAANAAYFNIVEAGGGADLTAGSIPGQPVNNNLLVPIFGPGTTSLAGFYGAAVNLVGSGKITADFYGWEASFKNDFNLGGVEIFTNNGVPGTHSAPLGTPLASFTSGLTGPGLVDFSFDTQNGPGGAVNTLVNGVSENLLSDKRGFFVSILNDPTATKGSSIWLFLDDGGSGPDDNHDDLAVLLTVKPVPVPAAGFLLVAGLGGLAALKRRKKA